MVINYTDYLLILASLKLKSTTIHLVNKPLKIRYLMFISGTISIKCVVFITSLALSERYYLYIKL